MGTNECSPPASKSWDSQDFGDVSMVLKMTHFRKSTRPMGKPIGAEWCNRRRQELGVKPLSQYGFSSTGPKRTNVSEISITIQAFSFKKTRLKCRL